MKYGRDDWIRTSDPLTPSLVQTLVTRGHSLSLLTKSFLSGHRYAQLSNFLAQISTRTMAEIFPAKSTVLDGHLRPQSSHAARRVLTGSR
jgi:hypothetical protein